MARDVLALLQRLRDREVTEAQRLLADKRGQEEASLGRAEQAKAALRQEALLGDPHAYASWLPRGRAEEDRMLRLAALANRRREEAEHALGEARAALRSVERLAELREEEAKREKARQAQKVLDEAAARLCRVLE